MYTLKHKDGSVRTVCKSFFLGTLGMAANNDTIIMKTFRQLKDSHSVEKESPRKSPCFDGRGSKCSKPVDEEIVKAFIETYRPVVSHYNREKTPLRRYLTRDVTVTDMHTEYISIHQPISFAKFYRIFKTMKISITSLGNEECEVCEKYRLHKTTCNCNITSIKIQYVVTYCLSHESKANDSCIVIFNRTYL